mmetsp:Transcript_63488/g.168219  ORF Transcript_63488/g.168219 Transcript_63488/m.168219 type:complete len:209 (+) Transcript_63488:2771-3397(+)
MLWPHVVRGRTHLRHVTEKFLYSQPIGLVLISLGVPRLSRIGDQDLTSEQLGERHTRTPHVHSFRVLLPGQHLRCHVLECSCQCCRIQSHVLRPPEISNLQRAIFCHQQIVGLHVPVQYANGMQVLHADAELLGPHHGFRLVQMAAGPVHRNVEQTAARAQLHPQEHERAVLSSAKELHHVSTGTICTTPQAFNLALQLVFHAAVDVE